MSIESGLDQYQAFTLTTAQYPEALTIPYLGLGLGDEAGELLEKLEKQRTGMHSLAWGREHVLPEAGDVCWYLAQLLHHLGYRFGPLYERAMTLVAEYEASLPAAGKEVTIAAAAIQGRLKKHLRDGKLDEEKLLHNAARVLRALDSIARFYGSNLIVVLADNRAKLQDRLERNVIKGEGDAR